MVRKCRASTSRGEGMTAAECDMNFMSVGGFSVFGVSSLQGSRL